MAKQKLVLEFSDVIKDRVGENDFKIGDTKVIMTPNINENYWVVRVKLHKNQSIIGFPKFSTIGVGFAQEKDWNTNFPFSCETEKIFNHIKHNKKYKAISDKDCIKAIKMIQDFVKKNKLTEEFNR